MKTISGCTKRSATARILALAMACSLAASLSGCLASPAASPGATGTALPSCTAAPLVPLSTDITRYSPLMSSAFGIHIYAKDLNGNPVKGNWTATWGQFCTASDEGGSWKIEEGKAAWDGVSDIWWQFPPSGGVTPSTITITFSSGIGNQSLLLEKTDDISVKVSDAPDPTVQPGGTAIVAYPSVWSPQLSSVRGIRLRANDSAGSPVPAGWSTQKGYFIIPPFRNAEGSVSLPDQKPVREMAGQQEVEWIPGDDKLTGDTTIEIKVSTGGSQTVLILNYTASLQLITTGELGSSFTPEEIKVFQDFASLAGQGKPTGELIDYTKANITRLNSGLGEVLADVILDRLENGRQKYTETLKSFSKAEYDAVTMLESRDDFAKISQQADKELIEKLRPVYDNGYQIRFTDGAIWAGINWNNVISVFGGHEGGEHTLYEEILWTEDEKPYVLEGTLEITLEELAVRYSNALKYTELYPLRTDWHFRIEQTRDAYLSSLLTLNGRLFSGEGFTVPVDRQDAYNGVIAKFAGNEPGKLLESWVALLKREGWKLTDTARDFLTQHGVSGYERLS